jgi:uncharacterized protein YkwD
MTARLAPALGLSTAALLLVVVGVGAMSLTDASSAPRSTALAVLSSTSPTSSAPPARVVPQQSSVTSARPTRSAPVIATASPKSFASQSPAVPSTSPSGVSGNFAPKLPAVPGTGATSSSQDARAVFDAINHARLAQHLPALTWSSRLQLSAQRHNLVMAADNTLAHQVGDEGSLGQRENQAGIRWSFAAENIGWTTTRSLDGALGIQSSMLAESAPDDAHRRNILSRDAHAVGIAVLVDAQHGRLWLTEDFADIG